MGDLGHQRPMIVHVLEHLHRDDTIKVAFGLEVGNVCREHDHVAQSPPLCLGGDVPPLGGRVGHRHNLRGRIAIGHPQGERSPPASQLEHPLAVGETGPVTGKLQHCLLGLSQCCDAHRPVRGGVFEARPQHRLEVLGGNLVVLLVGLDRMRGDRA